MSSAEKLPPVLRFYLDDTRHHLSLIERVLAAQCDMSQIILVAHSIRAASAHMGVPAMVDAANALESAVQERAKSEAQQDLLCMLAQIKDIFAETEEALRAGPAPA